MSRLKIGWAMRDISTTEPIDMPGQFRMRVSEGVLDPVTVTAMVLDSGDDIVIFLSGDMVGVHAGLFDEIRADVAAKDASIPTEKIIMNITHTHAGPAHYAASYVGCPLNGIKVADPHEYRHWLADQASDAIVEAYQNRSEGGMAYGYGYAVVAHSRRVVYFDDVSERPGAVKNSTHGVNGHAVMYGNTNDDMFSHYEAGSDHFTNMLYTFCAGIGEKLYDGHISSAVFDGELNTVAAFTGGVFPGCGRDDVFEDDFVFVYCDISAC